MNESEAVSSFKWSWNITIISLLVEQQFVRPSLLHFSWGSLTDGWAGLRWHSFLWFVALLMEAWYMAHTEQQCLLRCSSTLGQYKSCGGKMNSSIFSFWTMLFSSRSTKSGKKVGAPSALHVTMPWPLCFAGTGLGRNQHRSKFWSRLLHGVQHWWSLQRTSCKQYCDSWTCAVLQCCDDAACEVTVSVLIAGGQ